MKRIALAAVFLVLALSSAARAQLVTGSIVGAVKDESASVLPGVTVTLSSPVLPSGPSTYVTNEQGEYRFTNLRPGSYTLNVTLQGFSTYEETGLVVIVGGTTERVVVLKVATLEEKVIVSGVSPMVDLERVAVTTNLPQAVIENIPSVRYGFHEYVKWAPGVAATDIQGTSGNASVLGSSVAENLFMYDGINTNDPRNGTLWLGGAVNAIQEVQVVTMGASAEYQTAQGAVFNSVIKSGTNSFHGEYSQFFYNNNLISHPVQLACNCTDGNSTVNGVQMTGYNEVYRQDLLSDVGGPILKDRLWFFGAIIYNNRKETNPGTDPNIPFKYYQTSWLAKINWHGGDNTNFDGVYNPKWRDTPSSPTISRPLATLNASDGKSRTFNLQMTKVLSKNTLLTVRGGGYLDPDAYNAPFDANGNLQTPAVAGQNSFHLDSVTGIACCGSSSINLTTFYRWGQNAKISHYMHGNHVSQDVSAGVQFEQAQENTFNSVPGGVTYQDSNGLPSQATFRSPYVTGAGYKQAGAWGQDRVIVGGRLTLDLGVRWDRTRAYSPDEPAVDNLLQPTGTTVTGLGNMFVWNSVAPRVGANLKLTEDGKTLIRGAYGRAYRPVFISDFSIVYPNISATTVYGYNATTKTYSTLISATNPIGNIKVDPNLKDPYTDSYSVGLDRELIHNMALNVSYVHKYGADQIGWNDIGATYVNLPVTLSNGQVVTGLSRTSSATSSLFVRTNGPGYYNRYNGIVIAVEKRMSNNWQVNASYTGSKSTGLSSTSMDPNSLINANGLLSTDRPNIFATNGTYQFPKINGALAVNFIAQSGTPFAPQAQVKLAQGNITLNTAPPDGTYRLDSNKILYFRWTQTVFRHGTQRVEAWAELANALQDKGDLTIVSQNIFATTFNQANSWTLPRRLYFSAAYKF